MLPFASKYAVIGWFLIVTFIEDSTNFAVNSGGLGEGVNVGVGVGVGVLVEWGDGVGIYDEGVGPW